MKNEPQTTPSLNLESLKLQAAADQGTESVKTLAHMSGAYFRELLAQGFERDEAHMLVQQWLDVILEHARPKAG